AEGGPPALACGALTGLRDRGRAGPAAGGQGDHHLPSRLWEGLGIINPPPACGRGWGRAGEFGTLHFTSCQYPEPSPQPPRRKREGELMAASPQLNVGCARSYYSQANQTCEPFSYRPINDSLRE